MKHSSLSHTWKCHCCDISKPVIHLSVTTCHFLLERTGQKMKWRGREETMLLSLYLLGHMSLWTGEEMKWRGNDAVVPLSVRTRVSLDWEEMKVNEPGGQTCQRQTSWLRASLQSYVLTYSRPSRQKFWQLWFPAEGTKISVSVLCSPLGREERRQGRRNIEKNKNGVGNGSGGNLRKTSMWEKQETLRTLVSAEARSCLERV